MPAGRKGKSHGPGRRDTVEQVESLLKIYRKRIAVAGIIKFGIGRGNHFASQYCSYVGLVLISFFGQKRDVAHELWLQ